MTLQLDADYFDARGPNPRSVRMAAAEKGVTLRTTKIDVIAGENRAAAFLALNPFGTAPVLKLPSGAVIADSLAICEYLEEVAPQTSLLGSTPEQRGIARTWLRRIECDLVVPVTLGFRASPGREIFSARGPVLPFEAAGATSEIAARTLKLIDQEMRDEFLAGERLTLADIRLFCFLDFGARFGLVTWTGRLANWFERIARRPSAHA